MPVYKPGMDVGMNLPVMVPGLDRRTILEWSRRIDAGPFSSLAAGERITFPNPELMVTMAAAAAVTERVRLVLTVLVLPMHSAALKAKQVATLDVISGGRVTLGVGVGARVEDYRAVGARFSGGRTARLERQVGVMRRIWAGEPVEPGMMPIEPRPIQSGGPPILAGCLMQHAIERAARWADGICGFSFGPARGEVALAFDTARRAWAAAGRPRPRLVMSFWFALGRRSREQLDRYIARYLNFLGPGVAEQVSPTCTVTSPARLREVIREIDDLGCDEIILVPTSADPDEVDRVADLVI
jgi:alkanesulfonate monooxygenase SsuD/methylene tetrahydromethanopterin reductase-like flavin-dependent oxidoreductase (luciferase family)